MAIIKLISFLNRYKYLLTILLGILAIGVEIYYITCQEACSYLRGDLFSIPLEYIGIGYMILIIMLALFKKEFLLLISLSFGVGIEIYLVGFQIWHNVFCKYCLIFGGILIVTFILNFQKQYKKLAALCGIVSLILFSIFFKGHATPVYAEEIFIPEFGKGPVKIRLYTDYFCPPCRSMEPKIEQILEELFEKNKITITFIDTPSSGISSMYARYFLFILKEKKDFNNALFARSVLIGAALKKIRDSNQLEGYLRDKGINFKFFDTKPTFDVLINFFKTDKVSATPTCVIIKDNEWKKYTGEKEIINALGRLRD